MRNTIFYVSLAALLMLTTVNLLARDKPAYRIFNIEGEPISYEAMLQSASASQIVLFGELHNNPIAHWLQYELATDLYEIFGEDLVLGAEMFESDNQLILDEYLSGTILENHFRAEAKLWNNYATDYRPLVELARENDLPFIATNIPRRYAALVNRMGFEGLETLNPQAKEIIAPLPIPYDENLPGYQAMLQMEGMPAHVSRNLPKAQAVKDATMAHYILKNMNETGVFLHFHGTYHSNNHEGIVWYLYNYSSQEISLITIATVQQEGVDVLKEAHKGLADIIIAVPSTMTKTY